MSQGPKKSAVLINRPQKSSGPEYPSFLFNTQEEGGEGEDSGPVRPKPEVPTAVPGTGIVLDTPEKIAQWIEERRKRWPTAQVIAEKKRQGVTASKDKRNPQWGEASGSKRARVGESGEAVIVSPELPDDDSPPEEVKNTKPSDAEAPPPPVQKNVVCRFWKQGRCAQGESCVYLHTQKNENHAQQQNKKSSTPLGKLPPKTLYNPFSRADPSDVLLERQLQHVVQHVLDVVEFLERNDWLEGVELRPGEVEEEQSKIVEL